MVNKLIRKTKKLIKMGDDIIAMESDGDIIAPMDGIDADNTWTESGVEE